MSENPRVHRKWVSESKLTDFDEVATQYMHIFNLYDIFGNNGILDLEDQLIAANWTADEMQKAKTRGIQMSNWNKTSYIKHRVESTGRIPFEVSH